MSRTVYRISIMLHALWMLTAGSAFADDASAKRPGDDRWVPSVAFVLGFTTQEQEGSVDSCRYFIFDCVQFVRPSNTSEAHLNLLNVGGTFEIETPTLPIPFVRPRIFFGGEVEHVSSQRRSLAREGAPETDLTYPNDDPNGTFPDEAILGQGSQTTSDADTAQFGAFVGLSFPIDIGDWRISIRPSARYLRQKYHFTGILQEADRPGVLAVPPPTTIVFFEGQEDLDVHAVGPGLEIEVEAVQVDSILASVYVSGGAYNVLSDRKVAFMVQGKDNLNPIPTYEAHWSAEIDPWIYRASVGMRVRWVGARSGWFFLGDSDD